MAQRMIDNQTMQVADRVADGAVVAAGIMWLADIQTMSVAFSAIAAGAYYLVRTWILWKNRDDPDDD